MNQSDLISVIIPIHNGERHIPKTIPKLLKQSYKNLEIIIILNNCTDCSEEMCRKLAAQDSRIRVIEDNVVGLLLVRKRGVMESHGKYICWMDVDDCYATKYAIEKMHEAIVEDDAQIAQFGHFLKYLWLPKKQMNLVERPRAFSHEDILNGELMKRPSAGGGFDGALWSKIYEGDLLRHLMESCTEPVSYQEDVFVNFLALSDEKMVKASSRDEAYYVYYRYGGSMCDDANGSYKMMRDYALFKPIEYKRLNEIPANPEISLRVHSEGLWAYRAAINALIKVGKSNDEILSLIKETDSSDYIRMTKEYFRAHPENIWSEDMHFMISDYTPQEYLDWCREHLPPLTKKEKLRYMIKKVMVR